MSPVRSGGGETAGTLLKECATPTSMATNGSVPRTRGIHFCKLPAKPRPAPLYPNELPMLKEEVMDAGRCVECHLVGYYKLLEKEKFGTLDKLTALVGDLEGAIAALEKVASHHAGGDLSAEVAHFHGHVIPAMNALREIADQIEVILPDDLWPLPTYREMLFIK